MILVLELLLITIMISIASAIPGNFLVLRGQSLTTFALSHSILFGIVIMFLITKSLNSASLIVGAALTGLLIIWLVEYLTKIKHVNNDAALGIVYMFIFSIGVILIAQFVSNLAFNPKSIVTGNISLVVFDRLIINGIDLGPYQLWISIIILVVNLIYLAIFYKELKITSFNEEYAKILGINTSFINLSFMSLVSLTVVSAYRVAGVIMVVAIMIIPPATAYLLTKSLKNMILYSIGISIITSLLGFTISWFLGSIEMASMIGIVNGIAFLLTLAYTNRKNGSIMDIVAEREKNE